ncbi:uncharacterized protein [Dermacentor albipictus]|uniref:uncharacterized protein isoform X7 n=1 Tax=Dermacentor albipictus TaxID=60249 RepID=UPI0038FCE3B6
MAEREQMRVGFYRCALEARQLRSREPSPGQTLSVAVAEGLVAAPCGGRNRLMPRSTSRRPGSADTTMHRKQHARILLQGAAGANDDEMTEEDDDRRCSCARSPSSNAPCRYLQCQCKVGRRFLRAGHQPCLNHRPPTTPSSSHNRATQVLFPALTRPTSKTGFNFTNGRKASLPGTRAHTDAVEHEGIH